MNKKLMVVAIAAALAPVAAMADTGTVTIYGQMNASIDSVNSGYDATYSGKSGQRVTQINDNSSRLGFKGTEALGNGLTAVWQIESAITADGQAATKNSTLGYGNDTGYQGPTGSSAPGTTVGTRNTFVGLTGGFGTAVLGRHDTPYKLATRSLDVFADNIADNRSLMGQSGVGTTFDGRQSNVIAYISPNFSGFTGAIAYVAGAELANYSGDVKGDAWSAMGTYANGPVFASLSYEKHNVGSAGTGTLGLSNTLKRHDEKAWKLGGGYNLGDFKLGLVYEKTSDNFGSALGLTTSDLGGHHSVYLSGAYTFGSNVVKAAYTKASKLNAVDDSSAKQFSIGFDHNMSKRTTVYALYSKLTNDKGASYDLVGGSSGGVFGDLNSDPSVFSLGMKHSF